MLETGIKVVSLVPGWCAEARIQTLEELHDEIKGDL
jgi:hypothetical protein